MTIQNGICQCCARDYNDPDPEYHIESGRCPSDDCPSHDQNKSPPAAAEALIALVEAGWEAHLYKNNGAFECLVTPADVAKHRVGRGPTPIAAITEAIAKARGQQ